MPYPPDRIQTSVDRVPYSELCALTKQLGLKKVFAIDQAVKLWVKHVKEEIERASDTNTGGYRAARTIVRLSAAEKAQRVERDRKALEGTDLQDL